MKLNIFTNSKNELKASIIGEGHTFCNAIYEMLLNNDSVEYAFYDISHPLVGVPVFYIRMKGRKKPEKALTEASKDLIKNLTNLSNAFQKAIKNE